jgi:hypothetical protein
VAGVVIDKLNGRRGYALLGQEKVAMGTRSYDWPYRRHTARNFAMWAGSCVYVAGLVYVVTVTGPNMRAQAEAQIAREIEEENRAVCGRLGMGPETGASYQVCAAEIQYARRRHEDRMEARNSGPFL